MKKTSAVLCALMATVSTSALAQTAAPPASGAAGQGPAATAQPTSGSVPPAAAEGLSEIIVTAQRRSENSQKVPISISTVSSDRLVNAGIAAGLDLGRVVPSLTVNYGAGTFTPFLRGVGNPSAIAGNEASVATYIDGVYVARLYSDFLPLDYIDHIEVLKGPQGTLFGRNSSGGLINIITRTPSMTPTVETSVSYGNYQDLRMQAYVSGGMQGFGAISVSGFYENQNRGWGHNVVTGSQVYLGQKYGVRGKFVSDFSDMTKITLSGGYVNVSDQSPFGSNAYPGTTQGNADTTGPLHVYQPVGRYDIRGNIDPLTRVHSFDASGRLDQKLGFANLVSITGYRKSSIIPHQDYDYTPIDSFQATLNDRERQFTQEVQLLSKPDSIFTWIVGGYYANIDSGYDPVTFAGAQIHGLNARLYGRQQVKSLAGFGQGTLEILPRLKLTLGGRYTHDRTRVSGRTDIALPGGPVIVPGTEQFGAATFAKFTYHAALNYQLTPDVMVYGSASRGFKSGVFNLLPVEFVPAQPETVNTYEVGFKSELLDRHVRVNGSLFWNQIKNPQVIVIEADANLATINAGAARTRGAELEIEATPIAHLNVRASGTYLDAKYTRFNDAPYTTLNSQLVNGMVPGCSVPATGNTNPANGGNVGYCSGNATGNRLPRAAKFTGNFGFDYTLPIADGSLRFSPNLSYNSGFYWDADNFIQQHAFATLDATLAYTFPGKNITVRAYGRNLTQSKYFELASQQGGPSGDSSLPAAPRTYGIAFDTKF